jgi:predicted TIM-barrel fold metal-dependent hydrolase
MRQIVDGHHHIWRQADLPWLTGPMQPRIFGSYEPIRRDYPMREYLDDIAGTGVVRSIYVQTNWAPENFEQEAAWVQRTADEHGFPHAIVAYADLSANDVRPQLDRLMRYRLVRGVRMQLHWHENPLYRFAARRDLCNDPVIRRNVAWLADYGLSFDLQVFAGQMPGAAELASACPQVTFVLQHAGMLEDLSAEGRATWRGGMMRLAACPNVVSKLSGLGTFIHRNDPVHIADVLSDTVALFGAERCLFGSNFPIEKLWTGYRELVDAFTTAANSLRPEQRDAIFKDTAMRVYRLEAQPDAHMGQETAETRER